MVKFDQYRHQLKRFAIKAACLLMVAVTVWGGGWVPSARAVGSEKAASIMQDRAAAELDRMAGEKSDDVLKEAARSTAKNSGLKSIGTDLDTDIDLDEAGRKLKRDVRKTRSKVQSKAAELGDDAGDAADGLVDSVKDLFN